MTSPRLWGTDVRSHVHGLGIAGEATVRALRRLGHVVTVTDDVLDDNRRARADALGCGIALPPNDLGALLDGVDALYPAPGVPVAHPMVQMAQTRGVQIMSELELAYRIEQGRPGGPRPSIAVTGTDGKTTTVAMVAAILTAAGRRPVQCGNTDIPMVDATEMDVDTYVVECSSFRLQWCSSFRADAAIWLNLAPDHLDWHGDLQAYAESKARIWAGQSPTDISVGVINDPLVARRLQNAPGRQITVGASGQYRLDGVNLVGPTGVIMSTDDLPRRLPHDVTNALAAAAACIEAGLASLDDVAEGLRSFAHPPHRIHTVATIDGITYVDDSKATTPHAAVTAIRSFPSVVLIAGGRNKGLDMLPLASTVDRLRGVVAIGDAADEVLGVIGAAVPTVRATSMEDAVACATSMASEGDTVLLSPACASFDWYPTGGYGARGDHFARVVNGLAARGTRTSAGIRGGGDR